MAELTSDTTLGGRVRVAREARGLSREALAHAAGVSTSMLARLELQNSAPRLEPMARIARQLDLSLDALAETRAAP